jgi:hypothetical protein
VSFVGIKEGFVFVLRALLEYLLGWQFAELYCGAPELGCPLTLAPNVYLGPKTVESVIDGFEIPVSVLICISLTRV